MSTLNTFFDHPGFFSFQHLAELHNLPVPKIGLEILNEIRWLYRNNPKICAHYLRNAKITTFLRAYQVILRREIKSSGVINANKLLSTILKRAGLNDTLPERNIHLARPYQLDAQRAVLNGLGKYSRPICLSLATGAGKTRVANDFVSEWLEFTGGTVLWITKDWLLLEQAVSDFFSRHDNVAIHRIGGSFKNLPFKKFSSKSESTGIAYTTLQTFFSQMNKLNVLLEHVSLVVWDECHWGQNSSIGRGILGHLSRCRVDRFLPVELL